MKESAKGIDIMTTTEVKTEWTYDDEIIVDGSRMCLSCWLRGGRGVPAVRVDVSREFIEDEWGIEWSDKEAAIREFKLRRMAYLEPASKAAGGSDLVFRLYSVG
jgi:hypothetical protein